MTEQQLDKLKGLVEAKIADSEGNEFWEWDEIFWELVIVKTKEETK